MGSFKERKTQWKWFTKGQGYILLMSGVFFHMNSSLAVIYETIHRLVPRYTFIDFAYSLGKRLRLTSAIFSICTYQCLFMLRYMSLRKVIAMRITT